MGPFSRSGLFGIVGVFVVMALVAVVALTMGQGEAKPKDAFALIFGIVGVFVVLLFILQSRDLSAAQAADARGRTDPAPTLENPTTLDDASLWAALAVRPIDDEALRARSAAWGGARQSIRMGMLICALIFIGVAPIYLFDTFVPFLICAPLIAGIALWKSARLLAAGGDLDRAYEQTSRAMAPLGLAVSERPEITIRPRSIQPFRMGSAMHGALVLEGRRHGRSVEVRMPSEGLRTTSMVRVAGAWPEFEFRARDGRLTAEAGTPRGASEALGSAPDSTRWNGVRGHGGADGISVERKGAVGGDWLLDLWLAERLAGAVAGAHGASAPA